MYAFVEINVEIYSLKQVGGINNEIKYSQYKAVRAQDRLILTRLFSFLNLIILSEFIGLHARQ